MSFVAYFSACLPYNPFLTPFLSPVFLAKVKLREEEREAAVQHQQLVQLFDELLTTTVFAEKKAIVADVERFHTEKLTPQVRGAEEEEKRRRKGYSWRCA